MSNPSINSSNHLSPEEWDKIRRNRSVRLKLSKESLYWFFHLYFGHYIEYPTAEFQQEIFQKISDPKAEHVVVVAFRGSGKSTVVTMAFPLWGIVGVLEKKFVLVVSQTQQQAQQHLRNLRTEIEANELLRKDFGPMEEESNEWGVTSLSLPKFNAKIIAVSREQGVRGLRHGPYRPDLVISDDVEDTNSVKTKEGRNKTYDWFTSEILPIGDTRTKFVTIGNLLHEDSLLMRLRDGFNGGTHSGVFREYPIEVDGKPLWAGKFPDMLAIKHLQKRIGNRIAWEREYRLNIVPDDEQLVTRKMLHYYSQLPPVLTGQSQRYVIGVDLAIAEHDKADCTAMVTLDVRSYKDNLQVYVLRNPINKHIGFRQTVDTIKSLDENFNRPDIYIESTAYQEASIQQLRHEGFEVSGIKPKADKRSRLSMVADKIERGVVIFPETGSEELITQLVGFGIEKHDDLVDAFTMAVIEIIRSESGNGVPLMIKHNIYTRNRRRPNLRRSYVAQFHSDGSYRTF